MSIEILQKDRKLETGFINIQGHSWPSFGVLPSPKAKSIHGIALTNEQQIKELIKFLQKALKELAK